MRVVLVNWAPIAAGAENGGGANGYCQGLAVGLASRGHEVSCIGAGYTYVPGHAGPRARRHPDYRGVRVFAIVNSPVVAPGPCQHKDPAAEVSSPALEAEFARLIGLLRPDVVHFQNAEGFSAGCIGAAGSAGARVIFSLHNYHTVCPQVYLMQRGRFPCHSYENGHACTGCIDLPPPEAERRKRAELYARDRGFDLTPAPTPPGIGERLAAVLSPAKPAAPTVVPLPGREVNVLVDLLPDAAKLPVPLAVVNASNPAELAPLTNEVRPEPPSALAPNEYAARRAAFVAALSGCDAVVAVSDFVRRKFEALGVAPGVLRTLRIGSRMAEIVASMPEVRVTPPAFAPARPVRAAFIGYHNYYKGLHMLLDSLDLLDERRLAVLDLFVSAKGVEEILPRLDALRPRLARLTVERGYQYHEVPRLLCGRDVGLVPSVWWDNGPQTVMEFFACGLPVIAAELGGIPDQVRHGHDGLLHRGNDRADLARTLAGVLDEPNTLTHLRANVRPPLGMAEHVAEIEALYERVRR